jgi:hypothetical protein
MDKLTDHEKKVLTRSIDDIIRDSPKSKLALAQFKELILKAGKGAAKAMREIGIEIISETLKKVIWPHDQGS